MNNLTNALLTLGHRLSVHAAHIYVAHTGREGPLPYAQDVATNNTAAAVHDLEADHATGERLKLTCTLRNTCMYSL